jgi:hypothetical protein
MIQLLVIKDTIKIKQPKEIAKFVIMDFILLQKGLLHVPNVQLVVHAIIHSMSHLLVIKDIIKIKQVKEIAKPVKVDFTQIQPVLLHVPNAQ